jgi:hypothetical protein
MQYKNIKNNKKYYQTAQNSKTMYYLWKKLFFHYEHVNRIQGSI